MGTARSGSRAVGRRPAAPADRMATSSTDGTPRLVRQLTIAAALTGGFWAVLLVVWPDAVFALTFDDAWYYFGIARNVAAGEGSTFDGLNATNGYHPLWLMVSVPVYALGLDGMGAARTLLVVQALAYTAALVLLGRSIGRLAGGWHRLAGTSRQEEPDAHRYAELLVIGAFVLLAGNPFVVKTFVNGLESGVSVLLYAVLLHRVLIDGPTSLASASPRWRCLTGLLLLGCFLARTDAALLAGCVGLWLLAELRQQPWRETLVTLAELLAPVGIGIVSFLAFNRIVFGTSMQVSGLHKRADLGGARLVVLAVLCGLAVFVMLRTWRADHAASAPRAGRFPLTTSAFRHTGWFAGFCLLLVAYYNGMQVQQWLWYYAPLVVYALLLAPLAAADFAQSSLLEAGRQTTAGRALAPIAAILLLPLCVALLLQVRAFTDPEVRSIQEANRAAGEWIAAELPEGAVLASWDAGVVGYFAERPVVNLDGVVNSYEYYRATREGRVGAFLAEDGVGYIVNHGEDVEGEDPSIRPWLERTFGDATAAAAEVVHLEPFVFSGSTTGSEGRQTGRRDMAVFVYELPDQTG